MRPFIGISGATDKFPASGAVFHYQKQDYFAAVQAAGGLPVLLPYITTEEEADEILDKLDGLLLSGGEDPDPALYGEEPIIGQGEIVPERDVTELLLTRRALARNIPMLAICRGEQILAVAVGGSLYQDIPSQVKGALKHAQKAPRWYPTHAIDVKAGSKLAAMIGSGTQRINSYHHQAVKSLPKGWTVTAEAEDGIIEAFESDAHRFVVAVQWHPEGMVGKSDAMKPIFTGFVAEARAYKRP